MIFNVLYPLTFLLIIVNVFFSFRALIISNKNKLTCNKISENILLTIILSLALSAYLIEGNRVSVTIESMFMFVFCIVLVNWLRVSLEIIKIQKTIIYIKNQA